MNAPLMWSCAHCGKEARATVHQMRHTYCSRECMAAAYSHRMAGAENPNFRASSEKTCKRCGGSFSSYSNSRIYCSSDCYREDYRSRRPPKEKKQTALKDVIQKSCQTCGSNFATRKERQVHCSWGCYLIYRRNNKTVKEPQAEAPARRSPVEKTCEACGKAFTHGKSSQRYCSISCSCKPGMRRAAPPKPITVGKADIICLHCGDTFQAYKSSKRKFCSPKCHVDSGGPKRAGKEAILARLKYGPKKDANHNELMAVIREHVPAKDTSALGNGFPDGIAWINGGWHLFDIKNPATSYGKRGLNPIQKKWADTWTGGPVFLIHSAVEARLFAQGRFDALVKYPDDRKCIGATDACLNLLGRPMNG